MSLPQVISHDESQRGTNQIFDLVVSVSLIYELAATRRRNCHARSGCSWPQGGCTLGGNLKLRSESEVGRFGWSRHRGWTLYIPCTHRFVFRLEGVTGGKYNFTIALDNGNRIEVQLQNKCYFIKRLKTHGPAPEGWQQLVSWRRYSVAGAWEEALARAAY